MFQYDTEYVFEVIVAVLTKVVTVAIVTVSSSVRFEGSDFLLRDSQRQSG